MNECQSVSETSPLQQGDILLSHPDGERAIGQFFVVITADCDIDQKKFGDGISLLPILTAEQFVRQDFLAGKLSLAIEALEHQIYTTMARLNDSVARLSSSFLLNWLLDDGPDSVLEALVGDSGMVEFIKLSLESRKKLLEIDVEFAPISTVLDNIYDVMENVKLDFQITKKSKRPNEIKNALREKRVDFFYINNMILSDDHGWFVDLRRNISVAEGKFKFSRIEWLEERSFLLRIGRLKPVYKFAAVQAFANLFMRIGLPQKHDDWKVAVLEDLSIKFYEVERAHV